MFPISFSAARRAVLASLLTLSALAASGPAWAQDKVLRIGIQKSSALHTLQKATGSLAQKLQPLGVSVKWVEFPAGPQLLEGLNVGAVDVGYVGKAPPIFAQAAGAQFIYIGNDPASPQAEAVVVRKDSPIRSLADLKGRKVVLNKGSNVHYLLARLVEQAGLNLGDLKVVYLAPADARAAFESGNVDAWVIWDPFLAAAEKQIGARVLADGKGVVNNHQYYLAQRDYAARNPRLIQALFAASVEDGAWLKANPSLGRLPRGAAARDTKSMGGSIRR